MGNSLRNCVVIGNFNPVLNDSVLQMAYKLMLVSNAEKSDKTQ